jgi:hypothetical protein
MEMKPTDADKHLMVSYITNTENLLLLVNISATLVATHREVS